MREADERAGVAVAQATGPARARCDWRRSHHGPRPWRDTTRLVEGLPIAQQREWEPMQVWGEIRDLIVKLWRVKPDKVRSETRFGADLPA